MGSSDVRVLLWSRLRSFVALVPSPCALRVARAAAGPEILSNTMQPVASTILLHTRFHPENFSVMRALDGSSMTVKSSQVKFLHPSRAKNKARA